MKTGQKIGFLSAGIPNVSPKEAYSLCRKGAVIIDLRSAYMTAYKKFGVDTTIYPPAEADKTFLKNLMKDFVYIVAETSTCVKSRVVVEKMRKEGFSEVYNLAGGFVEWERDGLPIVEDKRERLTGSCACQLKPREKK